MKEKMITFKKKFSHVASFEIEKGIPLPPSLKQGTWINTIGKMEVGDSFYVHDDSNNVRTCAKSAAKRLNVKIATRVEYDKNSQRGIRVWRIND